MNNCDVASRFAASNIEAKSFDILSSVSSLASALKNRANLLRLASSFYSMNRGLSKFLDESYAIMSGERIPEIKKEFPTTPQSMRTTAENLEHVYRTIQYVGEISRRARLTNNSLTAGSLNSLVRRSEELLDFADWIEMMADPKGVKETFDRAKEERDRGEIYDMSSVG